MTSSSSPQTSSEPSCQITDCMGARYPDGRLCSYHRGLLRRALLEIPEHATEITAMVGHATSNPGDKVSGSRERPLPAAASLALTGPQAEGSHSSAPEDEAGPTVLSLVGSWTLFVEDALELLHQTYPSSLAGLRMVCATLTRRAAFDFLCSCDLAESAYDEITTVWKQVRKAARDDPQPQRGKVPCPSCGMRTLWQDEPSVNIAERGVHPVLVGGQYCCLTRLGGCGVTVQERDHDAAVVDLDTHIEQTKAVRAETRSVA